MEKKAAWSFFNVYDFSELLQKCFDKIDLSVVGKLQLNFVMSKWSGPGKNTST